MRMHKFSIRRYRKSGKMFGQTFHTGMSAGPDAGDSARIALHAIADRLCDAGEYRVGMAAHSLASNANLWVVVRETPDYTAHLAALTIHDTEG